MISVIISVYNVENYIEKCITSIIKQTYKNIEIIVVDDGSNDSSGDIADNMANLYDSIIVLHKQNGGLSSARNVGLKYSKGEYIMFVDGDDFIHPKMCEIMIGYFQNDEVDMVACNFYRGNEKEFINYKIDEHYSIFNRDEALNNLDRILVISCCKVFRSKLFFDIKYPENRLHEDEFVIHKLIYYSRKIILCQSKLYYYTVRNNSIMNTIREKNIIDACDAYEERIKFIEDMQWNNVLNNTIIRYENYIIESYKKLEDKQNIIANKYGLKLELRHRFRKATEHVRYKTFNEMLFIINPKILFIKLLLINQIVNVK